MQPPAPLTRSIESSRGPIVLVGASVRAAAESARRAGFSPIAIDQFGDRETIAASHQWRPLREVRAAESSLHAFLGIPPEVAVAIVGGVEGGFGWLKLDQIRFRGADPDLFRRTDQPEFLTKLADLGGVDFPETCVRGMARPGWLIKQRSSCGGLGVRYFPALGDRILPDEDRRQILSSAYCQKIVHGPVCGASFISDGRRARLLGVCRLLKKRIGQLPFVFAGAIGPIGLATPIEKDLVRLGDAFVAMSGLSGPLNIDVIIRQGEITLLEVNPRWSASMEIVERSWSEASGENCSLFDPISNWFRRLDGISNRPDLNPFIKRILFSRHDRDVCSSDFDTQETGGRWIWKDVPPDKALVRRNEPAATMIARTDRISIREAFRIELPNCGSSRSFDSSSH